MLWRTAQATSVLSAVFVVGLLIVEPDLGLFVTWKVLVPLVPALLLVAPEVWRNLCPIAVVHQLPAAAGRAGKRRLGKQAQRATPAVAALLFFTIVPLRLVVLNDSGPMLAGFVLVVLVIALAGGLLFAGKSGWCVSYCPVLRVERLYGQRAMLSVEHAHCRRCSGCVRSCYDLKPERSLSELMDGGRLLPGSAKVGTGSILRTATGIFAVGLPGFVLGYFTTPEAMGPAATYIRLAAFVAGGVVLLSASQRVARIRSSVLARSAAAGGAALYYWFTIRDVAAATHELLDIAAPPAAEIASIDSWPWR